MVFTVVGLRGFCLNLAVTSPLVLGMASYHEKVIWRQRRGEKPLYLHSQILVCIYSSTIKNSRVSQLTFGKAHKRFLCCLLLWEACGGGNMFPRKYCLKSPNAKLCSGLCISVGSQALCGQLWGPLGRRNSFYISSLLATVHVFLRRMGVFSSKNDTLLLEFLYFGGTYELLKRCSRKVSFCGYTDKSHQGWAFSLLVPLNQANP